MQRTTRTLDAAEQAVFDTFMSISSASPSPEDSVNLTGADTTMSRVKNIFPIPKSMKIHSHLTPGMVTKYFTTGGLVSHKPLRLTPDTTPAGMNVAPAPKTTSCSIPAGGTLTAPAGPPPALSVVTNGAEMSVYELIQFDDFAGRPAQFADTDKGLYHCTFTIPEEGPTVSVQLTRPADTAGILRLLPAEHAIALMKTYISKGCRPLREYDMYGTLTLAPQNYPGARGIILPKPFILRFCHPMHHNYALVRHTGCNEFMPETLQWFDRIDCGCDFAVFPDDIPAGAFCEIIAVLRFLGVRM